MTSPLCTWYSSPVVDIFFPADRVTVIWPLIDGGIDMHAFRLHGQMIFLLQVVV